MPQPPDAPNTGTPADAISWYNAHADDLAAQYDALDPAKLHAHLNLHGVGDKDGGGGKNGHRARGLALDIGAGSGRDAAWLAEQGFEVVAVEPAARFRQIGQQRHNEARIRWMDDRLPVLAATARLGINFDLILLSAVWMHVAPSSRSRAFRKIVTLLKPGGRLVVTLRHGPAPPERAMYPVHSDEIVKLANAHGLLVEGQATQPDLAGRSQVTWTVMTLRLPDDGTGALPLLRHIVLNDQKSSTYKLGLLRVVARIADGSAGLARIRGNGDISIPLGLVALYWLRLYMPLLSANLPQSPANTAGGQRLGFVDNAFCTLARETSPLDLRVGMRFERLAPILHRAISRSVDTIAKMPAHYMTYPDGRPVMAARPAKQRFTGSAVTLGDAYLSSFGDLTVPGSIWRSLTRFSAWVEPALITEWTRLMDGYAESQGRHLDPAAVAGAMRWADPARDVAVARRQATTLIEAGRTIRCVWSNRELTPARLAIDHCLPWSVWPCGDLWNLMPTDRATNNRKSDRLPTAETLTAARDRISTWWAEGYLLDGNPRIPERFKDEARASLPALPADVPAVEPDDVFAALTLQRLRLKQDQQVPEWQC